MLCTFLEQADRFSLDRKGLRSILYMSEKKKDQAKEVSSHYDLGNEFYKLWLDPTMSYSCAYFKHEDDTLEQAQRNKVDYILEKLYLKEGMTLLDIGCGWGFLLIEAAKKYGVKGYGCTLSKEQWKKGQERIKAEGLEGQVQIELVDYRDLEDKGLIFDRIVSVGMMEHVGRSNYATYMETANHLLKDGGIFLLHTITGHDEVVSEPWIRKYIFPGGTLPGIHRDHAAAHLGSNDDIVLGQLFRQLGQIGSIGGFVLHIGDAAARKLPRKGALAAVERPGNEHHVIKCLPTGWPPAPPASRIRLFAKTTRPDPP